MNSLIALAVLSPPQAAPPVPQIVHRFHGPMPTGVTVSRTGRKFVCFPRWGDPVTATVVELRGGREVPYPNAAYNRLNKRLAMQRFVSVQSVVIDPRDRLWALDTGSVNMGPTIPNGPKMVCFNLGTNRIERVIRFPRTVALPTSYLNDVRFDLRRGRGGYAFITDSSDKGPNAIIVVDLASGRSWRRLNDHRTTRFRPGFEPRVEGQALRIRPRFGPSQRLKIGADGIAISPDGERLYYCPLIDNKLYSVAVDALVDEAQNDAAVTATVRDLGFKGASDGLESDAQGRLYATDYQNYTVKRGRPGGPYTNLMRLNPGYWPDTLSVAASGHVYLLANSLHRQPRFQRGRDRRKKPYLLLRVQANAKPVALR